MYSLMGAVRSPRCGAQIIYWEKSQTLKTDQQEVARVPKQSKGRGNGLSTRENFGSFQCTKWPVLYFRVSTPILPSSQSLLLDPLPCSFRSNAASSRKPPGTSSPGAP